MKRLRLGPASDLRPITTLLALIAAVAGLRSVAATLFGSTALVDALVAPVAVLFGPLGVLGVTLGVAGHATLVGGTAPSVLAVTLGYALFGATSYVLWTAVERHRPGLLRPGRWPLPLLGIAPVAALLGTATYGWVLVAVDGVAFASVVPIAVVRTLPPVLLFSVPVFYLAARLLDRVPEASGGRASRSVGAPGRLAAAVAVVAVGWVLSGTALSVGVRDLRFVAGREGLSGYVPDAAAPALGVFVAYGLLLQVVLGLLAFGLCVVLLARLWGTTDRSPEPVRGVGDTGQHGKSSEAAPVSTLSSESPHPLSRRDAVLALGVLGVGAGSARGASRLLTTPPTEVERLTALAEAIYPSAVTPTPEFVERYVTGYPRSESFAAGRRSALEAVDEQARLAHGASLPGLTPSERESVLRGLGVAAAAPDPEGSVASRVRYYVVDELLLALYSTPVGGRLVGIPNPPGYPGGHQTYQEAPR